VTPRADSYDDVLAQVRLVWAPGIAEDWMRSANAFLEGARPIDVLALRGPGEVLEALAAVRSGAYA
jgi:uncharacterized protein (DUF2384 family)